MDWTITASVAFLTLILDLVDFAPQIKSFRFVFSLTYFIYYILHFTLGLLAASVLKATGKISNPFLLAFVAVLSSITVLENFTVRFGGQPIFDLPSVFEAYRGKMIEEESERARRRQQAEIIKLTAQLLAMDIQRLEKELMTMLVSAFGGEEATRRLETLKKVAGNSQELWKRIVAGEMVQLNKDYVIERLGDWLTPSDRAEKEPHRPG